MNEALQILLFIFLLFILLPAVAISIITVVRYIFRKIKGKKVMGTPAFIGVILVAVIGLAIIPPIPYLISESFSSSNIHITGNTATIIYDDNYDNNGIRYIEYEDTIYQEIIPSVSNIEYYESSENINLDYDKPLANIIDENQSIVEKYIYKVFKYPVYSRFIYQVLNKGSDGYIALDNGDLFYPQKNIAEKIKYYSNLSSYNYYVHDYNTDKQYDITLSTGAADEILKLSKKAEKADIDKLYESFNQIVEIEAEADYDLSAINGRSKDGLLLKSIGEVFEKNNKLYQVIDEEYLDDGTVILHTVPLSQKTSDELSNALKKVGI